MKENDGSGMDPCQELVEGLLFGGLVILVPVYIGGRLPRNEGFVSRAFLCHAGWIGAWLYIA